MIDRAEAMFERRHEEDRGDVAVALSASRAYPRGRQHQPRRALARDRRGARADARPRRARRQRLRQKQESVRKRMS